MRRMVLKKNKTMISIIVVTNLFTAMISGYVTTSRPQNVGIRSSKSIHLGMANSVVESDSSSTATTSQSAKQTDSNSNRSLVGRWEDLNGNYILRPNVEDGPPRALLHFLGGAMVGAVPHVSYRYVLERLADKGYLVVATPYNLSFDHLETCDLIIQRFERIAPMLARQYGAIPVVGVGHSCGALLQLLITSLFPDTPRAANALISFNNKPVKVAVPFFDEIVAPFFTSVAAKDGLSASSGVDVINVALQLARTASEGELPSDQLLAEAYRILTPQLLKGIPPLEVPVAVREGLQTLLSPSSTALQNAGILPLMNQFVDTMDQIPLLIQQVADGARDFVPTPSTVRAAARRAYRARRTLIIQYDTDISLDESEEIESLLKEAESVTRMKRPMVDIDVQRTVLPGGHATPCLAPPLELAIRAEDWLGKDAAKETLMYAQADATVEELVRWLEAANL